MLYQCQPLLHGDQSRYDGLSRIDTTNCLILFCLLAISLFFAGEYMMILYYCMTLNSVVNPWIYMMFNCNLVESLRHLLCPCLLGK